MTLTSHGLYGWSIRNEKITESAVSHATQQVEDVVVIVIVLLGMVFAGGLYCAAKGFYYMRHAEKKAAADKWDQKMEIYAFLAQIYSNGAVACWILMLPLARFAGL